ncbi:MAG TPA: site-2 protease family protein [Gaiellaceae bacterium]|jgi:Zn-dependent protease
MARLLPVPVQLGPGGLAPALMLGGLFAEIGARAHFSIALAAVVGAIGGTLSLVLHELGHARAARKLNGIRPVSVSLIWLGAGTKLEGAYQRGRDQVRVALAGPLMSFAIAFAIVPLLFIPMAPGLRDQLLTLIFLNVGLGIVSLIPASPLDGYKVLVGLLWSALGTEAKARKLIRRTTRSWLFVEVAGCAFLIVERPLLGMLAALMGMALVAQRMLVRRVRA